MATTKADIQKPTKMDPIFVQGTTVDIEDTEIRYSHMVEPDTKFGAEWSVHIKIEAASIPEMEALGFNIKEDTGNGTYWLKAKRVCRTRQNKDQSPPVLLMEDGTPVTTEPGNGTKASVHLWCRYTDPIQGKVYMGTYLNGATIKDLKASTSEAQVKF